MKELSTSDPHAHAANIEAELAELVDHLRRDAAKVDEPKAQALFETAAEVLLGLQKAFADYDHEREDAMTPGPV
jgi:hypothetical protein